MIKENFEQVKLTHPLVHNITNYVTVNDCANVILAAGGSPIMADDEAEVEEITAICSSLNINIGTLNNRTIASMIKAGKHANKLNHPVVLDPVGVGASTLRTETANRLLEEVKFDVIRGNISEIKTLAIGSGSTQGVDASALDKVTKENLSEVVTFVRTFAKETKAVIVITGEMDIISDEETTYLVTNGHSMMSDISGTGCMLSAILATYIGANQSMKVEAATTAVCLMGLAGELAKKSLKEIEGNTTYRDRIMDMIYTMTGEKLESGAKYEQYK